MIHTKGRSSLQTRYCSKIKWLNSTKDAILQYSLLLLGREPDVVFNYYDINPICVFLLSEFLVIVT
jgi:hypothetical protein